MKSLRVRLTLWFTLGFVALAAIFMFFTYRSLDLQLRRGTFQREQNINPDWILRGSYSEAEVEEIMSQLMQSSLIVSLPLVLVILVLGYFVARQSLRPIESLNRQLQSVEPRTLGRKVELPEADEQFVSLLGHLNEMLDRLGRSFSDMSEYAAKVAHELRTPLTIIRHKVEQSHGRIDPDLAEELQEELLRLTHVVDQSLLIAKADQGRLAWNIESFDLSAMLRDMVSDFHLLADAHRRAIVEQVEPGCCIQSDPRYCKQILHTLLTNALIHGLGDVYLRLIMRGSRVHFAMWNLVRATPTRSELTLGLGLRVVKALVSRQPSLKFRQHHGTRYHATSLTFPAAAQQQSRRELAKAAIREDRAVL
jgi:signal transduction histidine kinase